jgi:hypothetical protein
MISFSAFIPEKKELNIERVIKGEKGGNDSAEDFIKMKMLEEMDNLEQFPNISVGENEKDSLIDSFMDFLLSSEVNYKLLIACYNIIKEFRGEDDYEKIGKKIILHENEIFEAFNVTDEVKKMQLKENMVTYILLIRNYEKDNV